MSLSLKKIPVLHYDPYLQMRKMRLQMRKISCLESFSDSMAYTH